MIGASEAGGVSRVERIAIVGGGTMGGGIAIAAASAGVAVTLIDSNRDMLAKAESRLDAYLSRQVDKGKRGPDEADAARLRLSTSESLEATQGADLVIEAVFEDMRVKRDVFSKLERIVAPGTVLATNTSALRVSDIARDLAHPERLCGLHFFSPAEHNRAVEVIRAEETADRAIETARGFLHSCGKTPIACTDSTGFALNRFFCPYTNEAVRCHDEGRATAAQVDRVAKALFGVALGPFAVMNIVKPSINLAAVRSIAHLGAFYAPADGLVRVGERGDLWEIAPDDPPLNEAQAARIADRLKGAIFLAVREALHEGVAAPEDIDLGAKLAFTFAVGPVAMMSALGDAEVERLLSRVRVDRQVGSAAHGQ
ncbi:MAG: 3-hydroxyacyl-CoA dehydrogenase NAD-binding domain-containing protein [Pseudomonadota bacterium]